MKTNTHKPQMIMMNRLYNIIPMDLLRIVIEYAHITKSIKDFKGLPRLYFMVSLFSDSKNSGLNEFISHRIQDKIGQCICKKVLHKIYYVKNINNGYILPIGSSHISLFNNKILNEWVREEEADMKIEKVISGQIKNKYICSNCKKITKNENKLCKTCNSIKNKNSIINYNMGGQHYNEVINSYDWLDKHDNNEKCLSIENKNSIINYNKMQQQEKPNVKVEQIEKDGNTYDIVYLNIPFDEKEEAKKLGYLWWNPLRRKWYCNAKNVEKFKKWL